MFFLTEDHTRTLLTAYTGLNIQQLSPGGSKSRCALWHVFVASQDLLIQTGYAGKYLPSEHPLEDAPMLALLFEMFFAIQQKLESLEKELKKS